MKDRTANMIFFGVVGLLVLTVIGMAGRVLFDKMQTQRVIEITASPTPQPSPTEAWCGKPVR